jgi:type IV secretion system protein VirB1
MTMTWLAVTTLAAGCAPMTAPSTLAAVAKVESGFDPLAIGVNGAHRRQLHPSSRAEAVITATRLIASGQNIDLGLAQINSANLMRLGLTVERAFDACANLEASGRVLQTAYSLSLTEAGHPNLAVLKALSIYNTGRPDRGFRNGYVAKVMAAAATIPAVPVLPPSPKPAPPAWDVFAQVESRASFVLTPAGTGEVQ